MLGSLGFVVPAKAGIQKKTIVRSTPNIQRKPSITLDSRQPKTVSGMTNGQVLWNKYVSTFSLHFTLRQAQGEDLLNPHAEACRSIIKYNRLRT